jgi:hypothetical protein
MIELKFTGNIAQVTGDLFAFTSQLAAGKHLQNVAARSAEMRDVAAAEALEQPPMAEPATEPATEPAKRKASADKKRMPKVEITKESAPISVDPIVENVDSNVFDNDVIQDEPADDFAQPEETVAEALPDTEDGIRALAMEVIKTCGSDIGKSVIMKYAPKLSLVTKPQYADFGRDCYKALREKLS